MTTGASMDVTDSFKVRDAASYDYLIGNFDRLTDKFTAPLARQLVFLAGLGEGGTILDVGTGTGVVALLAAAQAGKSSLTYGVDLSVPMLACAAAKAQARGLDSRTKFEQMDAEQLAFSDCTFDVALSLYALLHFPNPVMALREMRRVLRPGGKLVVAIGSGPPLLSIDGLLHRMKRTPGIVGQLLGHTLFAPRFLDELVQKYVPPTEEAEETELASHYRNRSSQVKRLVRRAGFQQVRSQWKGCMHIIDDPDEFWDVQRTYSSISRKRLEKATPQQLNSVRQEFERRCLRVRKKGGSLCYHQAAFYVTAAKSDERDGLVHERT